MSNQQSAAASRVLFSLLLACLRCFCICAVACAGNNGDSYASATRETIQHGFVETGHDYLNTPATHSFSFTMSVTKPGGPATASPAHTEPVDMSIHIFVAPNERVEDGIHSSLLNSEWEKNGFTIQKLFSNILLPACDKIRSAGVPFRGCDGAGSRNLIGFIAGDAERALSNHTAFYMHASYTLFESYSFYCSHFLCDSSLYTQTVFNAINLCCEENDIFYQTNDTNRDLQIISISLGPNCHNSVRSVKLGLRKTRADGYLSGPFDLMLSNYAGVIECIRNDFRHFTDSKYLSLKEVGGRDGYFPYGGQHDEGKEIQNTHYGFQFTHESPLQSMYTRYNWSDGINHFVNNDFDMFRERYQKRINNFRQYLRSGKTIEFTLKVPLLTDTSELENAIRETYPQLNFYIRILCY